MKSEKIISVLGEDYSILYDDDTDTDTYGICERYSKEIIIYEKAFTGADTCKCVDMAKEKTLRHELLHAIFHEAGLDEYSEDETLVDCLAILYPKIQQIMESVSK